MLRGMTSPAGGTVAAMTTSLPERAEEGRNYDYRYSWIRDQCFVGHAAAVASTGLELLDGSVRFVAKNSSSTVPTSPPPTRRLGARCLPSSVSGFPGIREAAPSWATTPPSSSSWTCSARRSSCSRLPPA